jgi:hypothetical protein
MGFELEATMQQPLTSVQLSDARPPEAPQLPPRPRSIDDTGLSLSYISDLMLRALYLIGQPDDIPAIQPYERELPEVPDHIRQQALATEQAIRERAK